MMDIDPSKLADTLAATKEARAADAAALAERLAAEDAERVRIATEQALAGLK